MAARPPAQPSDVLATSPQAAAASGTLHSLAEQGKCDPLRWALSTSSKNKVNEKDLLGRTLLYLASFRGHADCVTLLLSCGADLELSRADGLAPLYMASWAGHSACVRILLSARANVNRQNNYGRTPLWIACKSDRSVAADARTQCVRLLMEAGANPALASTWPVGTLPIAMAREHDPALTALLESATAAPPPPSVATAMGTEPQAWALRLLGQNTYQTNLTLAPAAISRAQHLGASDAVVHSLECRLRDAEAAITPARQGEACEFWLLDAAALRSDDTLTSWPSLQMLRASETRGHWLRRVTLSFEDACANSQVTKSLLAVSHRCAAPTRTAHTHCRLRADRTDHLCSAECLRHTR
jgi:hypothetical protein